jgi:hypothetical protein
MEWRTEEAGMERVFWRPRSMNGEMEGERGRGEPCLWDALVSDAGKVTNLAPV